MNVRHLAREFRPFADDPLIDRWLACQLNHQMLFLGGLSDVELAELVDEGMMAKVSIHKRHELYTCIAIHATSRLLHAAERNQAS